MFPFASVTGTFTKSEVNAEVTAVEGLAVLEILGKFVDPDPYPINFTLEVGQVTQSVEVNVAAESALRESSASVGDVLTQDKIESLPLVGNNVLAQVPDLQSFVESMKTLLRPNGMITLEFSHLMRLAR